MIKCKTSGDKHKPKTDKQELAMSKYPKRTEYYTSFDTDFAGKNLKGKKLSKNYKYVRHGFLHSVWHFICYRCFATPLAFFHRVFIGHEKIIGKEKLRGFEHRGYFVYANHTQSASDAFLPNLAIFPKRGYIAVSPKNFSLPLLGKSLYYFGALPVPDGRQALRDFSFAISERISEGAAVVIYPEAHLWLYATKLRPFGDAAFTYPVRCGAPSFTFTRVYKRHGRGYRTELYIDGPFYPNTAQDARSARRELCETVREQMEKRCALSDVEIIRYERKPGA